MILINYKGLSMLELLMSQLQAGTPPVDLDYDTMQVLLAPDGVAGIQLGTSVAISSDGRIVALGAIVGKTGSINSGAVYVYEKTGDTYTWIQKLTPSDAAAGDQFGYSVSISSDGSVIVIGSYLDDDKGTNSGSAYIFKYNGTSYTQVQKLTASDGVANDQFGYSTYVSGDGKVIAVGSYLDDDKGTNSGSAYVFKYNGTSYSQVQKLTASDGAANDWFGQSTAISSDGTVIVVGSSYDDDKGSDSGSVYVYKYNGSSYVRVQKLTASDGAADDRFGYSVAISSDGTVIIIGSIYDDDKGSDSGSVYVYKYNGSSYVRVQKLTASDGSIDDQFGFSVAVSGDGSVIAVGSRLDDDKGGDSGSVYVFKYDGQSYQEVKKLTGNKVVISGYFGQSVAIASDTQQIVIGAIGWTNATNAATGAGFVFK